MARKSHLFEYHENNGKLTEFSGFMMPIWYSGIVDEHMAVRNSAGAFDVSHMGRVLINGREATRFLGYVLPTNPQKIRDGRAFYSVICNQEGGIVDDIITNRFGDDRYLMVVNAGNREKDLAWLKQCGSKFDVSMNDISNDTALIAFQGPLSTSILQKTTDIDLAQLKRFSFTECRVVGERCIVSRTGYTGEDGYEITIFDAPVDEPARALKVWNELLNLGRETGVLPCGLGARDSLRLEAGMCLYGQDIDEKTSPVEAALESVIDLSNGRDFVGRQILETQLNKGTDLKRIAFSMSGAGIPRHGFDVIHSGRKVGSVTSGTFSPILKKGIGMAYVPQPISATGQKLTLELRGSLKSAEIVHTPFYDTERFGYKRKTQVDTVPSI